MIGQVKLPCRHLLLILIPIILPPCKMFNQCEPDSQASEQRTMNQRPKESYQRYLSTMQY